MTTQERISAYLFILFGGFVAVYSATALKIGDISHPGPGLFPLICGVGIILLCILWLVLNWKDVENAGPLWPEGRWKSPAIGVAIISVYAALMDIIGYNLATLVFLASWQVLIENEKWKRTAIISIVGTAVMYFLFEYLLGASLPVGIFE